jgi:hypothetical protein
MLLTSKDIAIIALLALFAILFFIIKIIIQKDVVKSKDMPGGKLGKIIQQLEEEGFSYISTINELSYSMNVDDKDYGVSIGKNVALLKKGIKKYVLRIRSSKTTGKSITSTLIRYPLVELSYYGYNNIIFYDYDRSKYRIVKMNNLKVRSYQTVCAILTILILVLLYYLIR